MVTTLKACILSIGLMSGTSMDGVDSALICTDGESVVQEIANTYLPYSIEDKIVLKAAEYAVRNARGDMKEAARNYPYTLEQHAKSVANLKNFKSKVKTLDDAISLSTNLHLKAVNMLMDKTKYKINDIKVIGYHGQTLFHNPKEKVSIIVGDGQYLANKTGITVVNDFRSNDIAHGGQGAPFAPLYHRALAMRDGKIPVAVLNCGGIANITLINGMGDKDIIGYDTGPGNGLIDKLVRERTKSREFIDENAKYGSKGKVHDDIIELLYQKSIIKNGKNYYKTSPPKSLDIGDLTLIPEIKHLSIEDACATLETFTASTIVNSLKLTKRKAPDYWILAGGGWKNPVTTKKLKEFLPNKNVVTADEAGWNSQAMEAQIFAYLAVRSLDGKYISLPSTTGVPKPLTGGKIHHPNER